MKKPLYLASLLALIAGIGTWFFMQNQPLQNPTEQYPAIHVPEITEPVQQQYTRNLIIFYDAKKGKDLLLKEAANYGAEIVYEYNTLNGIAITIPAGKEMDEAIAYFEKIDGVLTVNRDGIATIQ